jgi:hypothetical protein
MFKEIFSPVQTEGIGFELIHHIRHRGVLISVSRRIESQSGILFQTAESFLVAGRCFLTCALVKEQIKKHSSVTEIIQPGLNDHVQEF